MNNTLKKLFLLLAFIEGGAVMCLELCSAKILSPYFGTSINVWAAVLGITLTSLMLGYYLGGFISYKNRQKETIFGITLLAGCLITLTPIISKSVLPVTIHLNILFGTVISLLFFLFVPILLLGSVSPLIINVLTNRAEESGKKSGTVFTISTLGGILTTFTVAFFLLPEYGITNTLYMYGTIMIITSIALFLLSKTLKLTSAVIALIVIILPIFQNKSTNEQIIYKSEGILGEIKVVDREHFNSKENKMMVYRELMVNNISQTIMDKSNPNISYWDYVNLLTNNVLNYSNGNKVLLLGLGGGTLYKQLTKNNFDVDVVEIDKRIEELAKKYFHISEKLNVKIDDARHYINTTTEKYDIIIYDLYHSETPPIHLMTKEAFNTIKNTLTDNGILIINFYGYINGNKGKAARSIYKTLLNENYHVDLITTSGNENSRNLLFIAGSQSLTPKHHISGNWISKENINVNDAFILNDDQPILEHIYLEAAIDWRKNYNEINAKQFLLKEI